MLRNPFNILNVSPDASITEIRASYRALAVKFHPDVNDDKDAGSAHPSPLSDVSSLTTSPSVINIDSNKI